MGLIDMTIFDYHVMGVVGIVEAVGVMIFVGWFLWVRKR